MHNDRTIRRFVSQGGIVVYKLPVEAFPDHVTNCYLVFDNELTLIDAASGRDDSNASLLAAFDGVREQFGERVAVSDVKRLILTHGHIDHFGGTNFVVDQSRAAVGIHELDRSTIEHFKERLLLSTNNLQLFLDRAGVSKERVAKLMDMNKWSKDLFRPTPVDFTFDEGPLPDSSFEVFHAPGHCPGQVCLKLHDILFTADHVLSHITPNQAPEFITRYTGLGHYIYSLKRIRGVSGIRLGLGGHEHEIADLTERIDASIAFHESRLDRTLGLCREPVTISQVSHGLFGERKEYHVLLALLEAGAHMEYLYERGHLVVTNVDEVEHDYNPVLRYIQS